MSCEGCAKDVSESLYKLDGIAKVEANVKEQLVRVEGTGMSFEKKEKRLSFVSRGFVESARIPPTFAHDAFVSSVKAYCAQSIWST